MKKILLNNKFTTFINIIFFFIFLSLFFYFCFNLSFYKFDFSSIYEYKNKFLIGFLNTIIISISSFFLSIFFSFILLYFFFCKIMFFRIFSKIYVELIRGTPLLVQILIMYYIVADSLGIENKYFSGIFILSLFSSAYISEIFKAGILSISDNQIQSAKSLGLKNYQIFIYIIFPQALKNVLAPLSGQFANLIKDSSLLSIISINELTQSAKEINSYTFSTLEAYIPLAIFYLILTLPILFLSKYFDKK